MRGAVTPERRPPTAHALTRRSLLAALPCLGLAAQAAQGGAITFPAEALRAYVDVLIPRDMTPEASALGIHHDLKRHAQKVPNYTRLLIEGGGWLENQAQSLTGTSFARLAMPDAIRVVTRAEKAAPRTLPRVFFTFTRDDVMRLYYGRAASWKGLGQGRAPQPAGYPDAHLPPGPRG